MPYVQPTRTEAVTRTIQGETASMESEVMPKTTEFKLSRIPLLDDYGEEGMRIIYDDLKENPSDKPRKLVITVSVYPRTMEIKTAQEIKLPKKGQIRVEELEQKRLFE